MVYIILAEPVQGINRKLWSAVDGVPARHPLGRRIVNRTEASSIPSTVWDSPSGKSSSCPASSTCVFPRAVKATRPYRQCTIISPLLMCSWISWPARTINRTISTVRVRTNARVEAETSKVAGGRTSMGSPRLAVVAVWSPNVGRSEDLTAITGPAAVRKTFSAATGQ